MQLTSIHKIMLLALPLCTIGCARIPLLDSRPDHLCGGRGRTGNLLCLRLMGVELRDNLALFNGSMCANLFVGTDTAVCLDCGHGYIGAFDHWELSLEKSDQFKRPLHQSIVKFPLPEEAAIKSRTVYSQTVTRSGIEERLSFWCMNDEQYFAAARKYAAANAFKLKIKHHGGDFEGQSFVWASKPVPVE